MSCDPRKDLCWHPDCDEFSTRGNHCDAHQPKFVPAIISPPVKTSPQKRPTPQRSETKADRVRQTAQAMLLDFIDSENLTGDFADHDLAVDLLRENRDDHLKTHHEILAAMRSIVNRGL